MIGIDYISGTPASLLVETFLIKSTHRPATGKTVNPWTYFGVPVGASDVVVKRAYRDIVRAIHPDRLQHLPPETRAPMEKELKKAIANYQLLTHKKSGTILRNYGMEGWRVYRPGDTEAAVREKVMRAYAKRYHIRDPFRDPLKVKVFKSPIHRSRGVMEEERFKFDPNSTTNEGRWRLRDPKKVRQYFMRQSSTPGVSYVMGTDSRTGDEVVQAVRFDKTIFTEKEATRWWMKNRTRAKFKRLWTWRGKR